MVLWCEIGVHVMLYGYGAPSPCSWWGLVIFLSGRCTRCFHISWRTWVLSTDNVPTQLVRRNGLTTCRKYRLNVLGQKLELKILNFSRQVLLGGVIKIYPDLLAHWLGETPPPWVPGHRTHVLCLAGLAKPNDLAQTGKHPLPLSGF
jgi:hypothetical protein